MQQGIAVFRQDRKLYHADTCEPLKRAAEQGQVRLVARGRAGYPGPPLPSRELREVRSVGYWDADHDQPWGLDWHRNEGLEITYVSRGRVTFSVDQQEFLLSDGDLTITRPWQVHCVGNPHISACRLHWIILDLGVRRPNQSWTWPKWLVSSERDIQELTAMLSHNEQPVWRADGQIEHAFLKLGEAIPEGSESHMKLHISGLIVALTDLLRGHNPQRDSALASAQRTVQLFLDSLPATIEEPWDLASMAAVCGIGRSQFTHYCRRIANMTPIAYLTHCRIQGASRLLVAHPKLSITEIGLRCGFESSQYFTRVFQKHFGCSPRAFRWVKKI